MSKETSDVITIQANFSYNFEIINCIMPAWIRQRIGCLGMSKVKDIYKEYKLQFKQIDKEAAKIKTHELKLFYTNTIKEEVLPPFKNLEQIIAIYDNGISLQRKHKYEVMCSLSSLGSTYYALKNYLVGCKILEARKKSR